MNPQSNSKRQLAIIYGMLPSAEEIEQLQLLQEEFKITIISSESIIGYFTQNVFSSNFECIPLPDHDDNTTFLPGLEKVLENFSMVIVKERLGIYAFQVVKAKWKHQFKLLIWVDNLTLQPGEDIQRMRTIRNEVNKAADSFLVQTNAARDTLLLEGIHAKKIIKFGTWVEKRVERTEKTKRAALEKLGLSDTDYLIVHNGQVEWEEGLLELLHGLKLVKEQEPTFRNRLKLAICGIGSFATELKQRSLALDIDSDVIYLAPNRESYLALTQAAEAIFVGGHNSRDRTDGDPYRIISAMTNGIPIIAARTPIVEELLGKHRFDYCLGSAKSICNAIKKLIQAKGLQQNIIEKNLAKIEANNTLDLTREKMLKDLNELFVSKPHVEQEEIVKQIEFIESKISQGQYLAAVDLIEATFELKTQIPNHHKSNLYRLIGDCFAKLGDNDGGKNAYIHAVELDPYSPKAHIGLGTVSLTKSNYDIAIIHFQKAISLSPNDEMANLGLGLSFHGLDEVNEAHKWVLKSLELNPENTAAIFTIVKIAQEREIFEDVEAVLRNYLKLHPHDHNMLYTLGGILYKMGKFGEVISSLQEIIAINPMDARAQSLIKQAKRALSKESQTSVG